MQGLVPCPEQFHNVYPSSALEPSHPLVVHRAHPGKGTSQGIHWPSDHRPTAGVGLPCKSHAGVLDGDAGCYRSLPLLHGTLSSLGQRSPTASLRPCYGLVEDLQSAH
ncbi:hypothetical protein O6H91_22G067700 [Diphasiastrum complanatum]|uniref:Uncharacterized protein n=1 Tax=Diphasiastrum complanatum TaxID=34168 RepID=A0ACC2AHX3_DIPCM|nr:hypothetical protein O6H91_22G067700 [Diphasiastrum complanatum]